MAVAYGSPAGRAWHSRVLAPVAVSDSACDHTREGNDTAAQEVSHVPEHQDAAQFQAARDRR